MHPTKISLPLHEADVLLQPGAVLLLGTLLADGRPNAMALAWYTLMDNAALRIACVLRRDRLSWQALVSRGECVLNIPSLEQIEQVLTCGTLSARDMDKLACLGWSTTPAARVAVPLVLESCAHIECRVVEQRDMGDCSVFVLEAVAAWRDAEVELPEFHAAPGSLLLRAQQEIERRREELRHAMQRPAGQSVDGMSCSLMG